MPQSDIFFRWQTHCRNDCRPPNWILSTKVSRQLHYKWTNENPWFSYLAVYYPGPSLMPQSDIFFRWQTHCRNDCRHPNWILSTKVSRQLHYKWTNDNPWFSYLALYYRGPSLMPLSDIFFRWQTHCRNDCRPPDWILSTKVSCQLHYKWTNENPWFSYLAVYYRGPCLMLQSDIFFRWQTHSRNDCQPPD
jgi:hypothetical protein